MAKILLVEDEQNIASFIERGLQEFNHEVRTAFDGQTGWEIADKEEFQLLLLDVVMPRMSGLELCRRYRNKYGYSTPIIMLTALGTTDDIVSGLDAGADDYITKPFSFTVLEARIKALLRRIGNDSPQPEQLTCGDLTLDLSARRALRGKKTIELTVREFRLLECLMRNKGMAQSRLDLFKEAWDKEMDRTNVVDVYVNYLRTKIDKGFTRKLIHTVTGVGYMIDEQ
jgi:DNA-binding response OmpR family regulator